MALHKQAFGLLRIIRGIIIDAPATLVGSRRSSAQPSAVRLGGAKTEFGPGHPVGSDECENQNGTSTAGSTAPGVELVGFSEGVTRPGDGGETVGREVDKIPTRDASTRRGAAGSALNLFGLDAAVRLVRELVLEQLPNDITKLVYLASLRDCNTGHYFHPQISQENDSTSASQALRLCHEEVFAHLVATPLAQYVAQLSGYIHYTGADKGDVIETWKSLPAYRATVPLTASALDMAFFFASVEAALTILDVQLQGNS